MTLFTPDAHPHGMDATRIVQLFTRNTDVVFAFHGYQRAIHELVHAGPTPSASTGAGSRRRGRRRPRST